MLAINDCRIFLVSSSTDCGVSNRDAVRSFRIFGGKRVLRGTWPWQVSMQKEGYHSCGGSIINERWIVTAAHCFEAVSFLDYLYDINNTDPRIWQMVVGEHKLYDKRHGKNFSVGKIIQHHMYDSNNKTDPHDIAMVKLKSPLVFGRYIKPICLPRRRHNFDGNRKCFATGWGRNEDTDTPHRLYQVRHKVKPNSKCRWRGLADSHVCFGKDAVGTCDGDSGGPLSCKDGEKWYLAGITSWGSVNCQLLESVFVRTSHFLKWVRGIMRNN